MPGLTSLTMRTFAALAAVAVFAAGLSRRLRQRGSHAGLSGHGNPPGQPRVHVGLRGPGDQNRVHGGALPGRWARRHRQGPQRDRSPGDFPGQHAQRHHRGHRPVDRGLRGDRAGRPCGREQHPARRAPVGSEPGRDTAPGQAICHFGVITGETCGTVESVNNGWFTMSHGVQSQKGDSGGPVYLAPNGGSGQLVGIFNSVWGDSRRRCRGRPPPTGPPGPRRGGAEPQLISGSIELEYRDRWRGGEQLLIGGFRRQPGDVVLDLPVPPGEVAPQQLGLGGIAHLGDAGASSWMGPARPDLHDASGPDIARPLGVAPGETRSPRRRRSAG